MSSNARKKVLLVGLRSDSVDYEKWPELSPKKLERAFEEVAAELEAAGYDARWSLTDRGETAEQQVRDDLAATRPDLVMIGAGVRKDDDHFLLFERLVNAVHEHAPRARIAFNALPYDTLDAVRRWV